MAATPLSPSQPRSIYSWWEVAEAELHYSTHLMLVAPVPPCPLWCPPPSLCPLVLTRCWPTTNANYIRSLASTNPYTHRPHSFFIPHIPIRRKGTPQSSLLRFHLHPCAGVAARAVHGAMRGTSTVARRAVSLAMPTAAGVSTAAVGLRAVSTAAVSAGASRATGSLLSTAKAGPAHGARTGAAWVHCRGIAAGALRAAEVVPPAEGQMYTGAEFNGEIDMDKKVVRSRPLAHRPPDLELRGGFLSSGLPRMHPASQVWCEVMTM